MKSKFNLDRRTKLLRRAWWDFKDALKELFISRKRTCQCEKCRWADREAKR